MNGILLVIFAFHVDEALLNLPDVQVWPQPE